MWISSVHVTPWCSCKSSDEENFPFGPGSKWAKWRNWRMVCLLLLKYVYSSWNCLHCWLSWFRFVDDEQTLKKKCDFIISAFGSALYSEDVKSALQGVYKNFVYFYWVYLQFYLNFCFRCKNEPMGKHWHWSHDNGYKSSLGF